MRLGAILFLLPAVAVAQPPQQPAVPLVKLTVTAADAPLPVLRYELLPNFREQVRGNAALSYHRAILLLSTQHTADAKAKAELETKIEEMCAKPAKEIKVEALRDYLKNYRGVLREIELGAKCDSCDWDLERRLDLDGIALLLPEVQKMREIARLLSVRCRLHSAEGKMDEAIHDIRTGFVLSRHVGEGPTMMQALVGIALFHIFSKRLEQLLEDSHCPNLYWALTALPRPFHDMRKAIEGEIRMIDGTLPFLKDLEKGPMSGEQVRKGLDQIASALHNFSGDQASPSAASRLAVAGYVALQLPNARRSLLQLGKTEAELDAMPGGQIVMLNSILPYRSIRDEMFIGFYLPYAEAFPGMKRAEEKLKKMRFESEADILGNMMQMLIPAVERVHFAAHRSERKIALLRTIEALRMHAAANGNRFPAKLAEMTLVPVPNDPITNQPFVYALTAEGKALLTAPTPKGQTPNAGNTLVYELTLNK